MKHIVDVDEPQQKTLFDLLCPEGDHWFQWFDVHQWCCMRCGEVKDTS